MRKNAAAIMTSTSFDGLDLRASSLLPAGSTCVASAAEDTCLNAHHDQWLSMPPLSFFRTCCLRCYENHQECGCAFLACQQKPLKEQAAIDSSQWQSSSSDHRSLAAEHLLGRSLLPAKHASHQQAASHTPVERHTSAHASDVVTNMTRCTTR